MKQETPRSASRLGRRYDRAAKLYEWVSHIYSTGQIRASKEFQLSQMDRGDQVLFVGVGAGEDALLAARKGVRVTCVDVSRRMLDELDAKLTAENLPAELICQSALELKRLGEFDAVAANYFLNVFRRDAMVEMLNHTARLVRPGGKYLIADVSLPLGNPLSRAFNLAYLKAAMGGACLLGLVPWHENYDYVSFFPEAGLEIEQCESFRFARIGPILFQSLVGVRVRDPAAGGAKRG